MFVEWIGKLAASLSPKVMERVCAAIGGFMRLTPKTKVIRKNIRRTFPELTAAQVEGLVRENCKRTVELGALGLAGRFLSKQRWQQMITISDETMQTMQQLQSQPRGVLFLTPHTTLMEGITAIPHFFEHKPISVLYRAFGSASLEKTMLVGRQGAGMRLLNRSRGLYELIRALRRGENGGMLFDQKSGQMGVLFPFMERLATASDLPDILYRTAGQPIPVYLSVKRTGFWRGELVLEQLSEDGAGDAGLTLAAHQKLEAQLQDPATRTDWLWAHDRWNTLRAARRRLGLNHRKVAKRPSVRNFRVFVLMPSDEAAAVAMLPLLKVMRESRPDMHLSVGCQSRLIERIREAGVAEEVFGLPTRHRSRVKFLRILGRDFDFEVALGMQGNRAEDRELLALGADDAYSWAYKGKGSARMGRGKLSYCRGVEPGESDVLLDKVCMMLEHYGVNGITPELVANVVQQEKNFRAAKVDSNR